MLALGARAPVCLRGIRRHDGSLLAIVPASLVIQAVINGLRARCGTKLRFRTGVRVRERVRGSRSLGLFCHCRCRVCIGFVVFSLFLS
jgi:hypothetical protein